MLLSAISLMSAPAANAFSEPVMTMQPILSSASNASTAAREFAHQRAVERVERLRPIEPDQADPAARLDDDVSRCSLAFSRSLEDSLLACRTIKRRAAVLHDALDGAVAARRPARLAFAIVDAEVMLEHAELAVGAADDRAATSRRP